MQTIIDAKNISKKYNIDHQRGGYISLRDVIMNVLKSPFSFLKNKAKSITGLEKKEEFWALDDVSFKINKGDIVGIIGANGAGKSTLLKILSQITPPTKGEIVLHGRVGSLLEVGTGFHPELTGRENIFLNGAILGMKKREISEKFDEIVSFAGIEKFLDTPVKHYSSGMYVRLAFSVAAHMESDILLVDEVLAVGDAEFQKKCLGKMDEITKKEGRTILFVSHNMGAMQSLCSKVIWLEKGKVKMIGATEDVIHEYTHNIRETKEHFPIRMKLKSGREEGFIQFNNLTITNEHDETFIRSDHKLKITLDYTSSFSDSLPDTRILISIWSGRSGRMAYLLDSHVTGHTLSRNLKPNGKIVCTTENLDLAEGRYMVNMEFLSQEYNEEKITLNAEFEIVTDGNQYEYRGTHDKKAADHMIRYAFDAID